MKSNLGSNLIGAFCFALLLTFSVVSNSAHGQNGQKYFPDHPDVEAMVSNAVKSLHQSSGGNIGEQILSAIAIVQARKRYFQEVPVDDAVVKSAIAGILARIPSASPPYEISDNNFLRMNEVYLPSIAIILLAEVNQSRYKEPIRRLIQSLEDRQMASGAFNYLSDNESVGDTSQTQFVALAMFVAKQHGFAIKPESSKKALQWLIDSQQPEGYFLYKLRKQGVSRQWVATGGSEQTRLSIHLAGLSTAYLLADLLQIAPRKKSMSKVVANDSLVGLPKTVSVYVRAVDGDDSILNKTGPLVSFDMGGLNATYQSGNRFLETNFSIKANQWQFYYLYALERYSWYREQAEGDLGNGKIAKWYDGGVEFLKKNQGANGAFTSDFDLEKSSISTAFAVLFLVRSSEVISMPSSDSELQGGLGFPTNQIIKSEGGEIIGSEAEKNLADMISMLKQEPTAEQLEALTKSMKNAVVEFKNKEGKSRGEIKSFLRTMISARDYYRRKIAVRFLAGEQDMDNVPALLYALGDPDLRICIEAHDGLRLISRKIDSLPVTAETRQNAGRDPGALSTAEAVTSRLEFDSLKKEWTTWFLKIRPGAELLD